MSKRAVEISSEALDRWLTEIQIGQAGIDSSSSQIPEAAASLGSLLETAERVRRELAPAGPERAFVDAALARVLNRARVSPHGKSRRPARPLGLARPMWRLAYALATVLLVVILLGGVGVVRASAQALPGGSLYGVKRAVEEAQLALTWSASGDAGLLERFAEERLNEASIMASEGKSEGLETALNGYDEMIGRLTALAGAPGINQEPGSLTRLQQALEHHIEVLEDVSARSPESAQEHIDKAIESSRHGQAVIEQLEEGGSPSDLAPGQQKTPEEKGGATGDDQGEEVQKSPKPRGVERTPGPPPWADPGPSK